MAEHPVGVEISVGMHAEEIGERDAKGDDAALLHQPVWLGRGCAAAEQLLHEFVQTRAGEERPAGRIHVGGSGGSGPLTCEHDEVALVDPVSGDGSGGIVVEPLTEVARVEERLDDLGTADGAGGGTSDAVDGDPPPAWP